MNRKILIIDHQPKALKETAELLRMDGYSVIEAIDGKAGAALAIQELPDLILCEMNLPVLDGRGVFYILGKDPSTAAIPFIFTGEEVSIKSFREAMNLGADDFLQKPMEGAELLNVIEIRLNKRSSLKKLESADLDLYGTIFKTSDGIKEIERLTENRIHRTLKRKEVIFSEGQMPTDVFYILRGMVKSYLINKDGKELITRFYHPGDFIGYLPILQNRAYRENGEVVTDAEIGFVSKQDFLSIIISNSLVSAKFIGILSKQLQEAESRLLGIAYDSVRQKVAQALLQVNRRNNSDNKPFKIARRDLSSMIGTATESLNRTLSDFKDEGLIQIMPEGIQILNAVKLDKIR
jgi:hypothetical protein